MSNASTLVYITYARADRARVDPVVVALRERGFTLALDPTSAHGAGDYVHESQRALQQANALVVFISQASAQSAWVEAETRAFQATMARGGARRLIPVRLDETLLPSALAVYTAVDGVSVAPAVLADTLADTLGDAPASLAPDAATGGVSADPPMLSQYSPTLVYDLATMSKLTGLRPLALWTFEQHLGIAQQAPLEAQDRASPRYSERDLVALNWLRDRIIAGEPTSDAAARLLVAQLDQPATPAPAMESTASVAVAEPPTALVYVACARADLARVEPAVAALRERGFNVHFDAAHAHGSGSYVHESQQALRQADAFVVFVSRVATQSAWVEAETRAFQATMARDDNRKLIPVRLDDSPLPLSLAHYSAIDGATATATALADAIASALDGAPAQPGEAAGETAVRGALASSAPDSGATWPAEEAERGAAADVSEPDTAADIPAPAPAPEPAPSEALPAPAPAAPPAPPLVAAPVLPPPVTPQPITQPGGSRQTTGAPAPKPAPAARAVASAGGAAPPQSSSQEQVTFIAYHPREVPPQQWQPLVVYLSLDNAATMALVAAAAAERLAGRRDQFRPGRSAQATGLARGAALRIIPTMPGFEFNPGRLDVTWQEDVQQHEFRMRATSAQPGQAANGVVQFFQGMLLRGEVPISAFVGQSPTRLDSPDAYAQAIARAYRRIFASYSHQDMPVVESCESAARTMGDQYLRDVSLLQSGQQWDPRLIQAINDADIFQLFWSKRAAASPFVEREWQHALMLLPARPNFIRPVYWTRQLYPTPTELNALHFQPLSLSSLGWGRLRAAWYEMRNR